jgi:hypothetical protein
VQSSEAERTAWPSWLPCALLVIAVCALFGGVVRFPFIAFDDAEFILRNPEITDPLRAPLDLLLTPNIGYVVPVTVVTEAVLFSMGHGAPWPFHAAALVLHALYVCQLFWLMRQLGARELAAWLAVLLFAVHPLVVQPIAWAICLKDLLMANLVLLALRRLQRSLDQPEPRSAAWDARTAVLAAVLAMLAKPSATLLGFAWLAYAWSLRAQDRGRASKLLRPALVVTVAGVVIGSASRFMHQAAFGHLAKPMWAWSTPFEVLGLQLQHVLWPVDLLVMYPGPDMQPSLPWLVVGFAAVALVAVALIGLRHSPRGWLLIAVALAVYLPTSNVIPFGRVISDSYAYVPLSLLAAGVALATSRLIAAKGTAALRTVGAVGLGLALVLAGGSQAQLPRYRGGDALWGPVIRAYPRFSVAHVYFADELMFHGQPARASQSFARGYAYGYDVTHLLEYGTSLMLANRLADAECVLIEASAYGIRPGYARFNLAAMLASHADYSPQHPAIVARVLHDIDALRRAGRIAWPKPLEPGLARQLERTRNAPLTNVAWPERNCAALRATQ